MWCFGQLCEYGKVGQYGWNVFQQEQLLLVGEVVDVFYVVYDEVGDWVVYDVCNCK